MYSSAMKGRNKHLGYIHEFLPFYDSRNRKRGRKGGKVYLLTLEYQSTMNTKVDDFIMLIPAQYYHSTKSLSQSHSIEDDSLKRLILFY